MRSPNRIYFAGKIGKNDWRHKIVPGLRGAWHGACLEPADPEVIVPIRFELGGTAFDYAGPYFVGCDHGCFHGPESHGIVDAGEPADDRILTPERYDVFGLCLSWLQSADVVFAHVESGDAQGTMFELGWAFDRIQVFLNFTTEALAAECWFAARSACRLSVNPDPVAALTRFLPGILAHAECHRSTAALKGGMSSFSKN